MQAKKIAKKWLPPALLEHLKPLLEKGICFPGNYVDWETPGAYAAGYDSALPLVSDPSFSLILIRSDGNAVS